MRLLLAVCLLAFTACGESSPPAPRAKPPSAGDLNAQVEAAVRKHLSRRSDLDMSKMDLSIQNVSVEGETAEATVGFQVKGAPESAMSMNYRLVKEAGEWVVQPNEGAGHGAAPPQPAQPLPPGHPPVAQ
jgi:hypothetical protein